MRVLYIHGLQGYPKPEKMAMIEKGGHEMVAPKIDYTELGDDTYDHLKKIAEEGKVEYIVGSSMGGYFGYWLGHDLGLPQLLFNPALPFRSMLFKIPEIEVQTTVNSWVLLGANDMTIPAKANREFFKGKTNARVITCEWLEHRIDLQTFEEAVRWAGLT